MTRPHIVRADTLDLQDQDSPQAANHTKQINGNGIAPHQAAEYQHVAQERHSEEQALADAWNMAGATLEQNGATNGDDHDTQMDNGDNASGEESEGEGDDDLMDRISSSPSIDEGKHDHAVPALAIAIPLQRHRWSDGANFNISLRRPRTLPPRKDSLEHYLRRRKAESASASLALSSTLPATALNPDFVAVPIDHVSEEGEYGRSYEQPVFDIFEDTATIRVSRNAFRMMRLRGHHAFASRVNLPDLATQHILNSQDSINSIVLQDILLPEHDPLLDSPLSPTTSTDSWESYLSEEEPITPTLSDTDHAFRFGFYDSQQNPDEISICLQSAEEIDFDFVYALHTFTATVEGQANATKGDTMVLLDDSNSYWWLVRVVKDSSIGYLPAEHIETPRERLARLNKHRNIDLAQTMLGDNPEKSRNPLKMAMRRRQGKTVQFAAPTYFDASDYDYSDDEEQAGAEPAANGAQASDVAVSGQPAEVLERDAPEEANAHASRRYSGDQSSIASKNSMDSTHKQSFDGGIGEDPQLSPKLVDRTEAAPLKSRKGTPRNTDSFLKDDSIETRKITLTPGLLREDNNQASSKSSSMDSQRNTSMESLTKVPSPSDTTSSASLKGKDKDKKKDKQKGGMLSGLFKSKKKEKKGGRDDGDDEKSSMELARGASPNPNGIDRASAPATGRESVQRNAVNGRPISAPIAQQQPVKQEIKVYPMAELPGSEGAYEMVGTTPDKTPKVKRSKERMQLDDFDSPDERSARNPFDDEDGITTSPSGTITGGLDFVHIPTAFGDDDDDDDDDDIGEPSVAQDTPTHSPPPKQSMESAREVEEDKDVFSDARENTTSPVTPVEPKTIQPPQKVATPTAQHDASTESSRTSSLAEAETPKSATPTASQDGKHNWDDGALRAWLDAEEVKDMLTIVHASARLSGNVEPVSDDHPLMRGLYAEERGSIERMMGELDNLMLGWAGRKGLTL